MLRPQALSLLLFGWTACAVPTRAPSHHAATDTKPVPSDRIELVESAPVETTLNHADIRDAADVWPEMIASAKRSIDLAGFYISDAPKSRLNAVLDALERAADRGVRVRVMVDISFYSKYPESVDRLAKHGGIETRKLDVRGSMGGILHAKYFVVDDRLAFVGSQNFDWRALEHIQEMGVRLESGKLARALRGLFEADWAMAGGAKNWVYPKTSPFESTTVTGDGARIELAASPTGYLPDERAWDLRKLVAAIDGAKHSIEVQLLTYKPQMRDGTPWTTLDDALRRAAARGVTVRLLISHWGARDEGLLRLARDLRAPSSVRIITIPTAAAGEIPFARVSHAKYAVFDGVRAWVGTSNWEGDYFLKSRNVSIFIEAEAISVRLRGVFEDGWKSGYAKAPATD